MASTKLKLKKPKPSVVFTPLTEDYVTSKRGQHPSKERWDASQIPVSFSLTSPSTESDLGNAAIVRRAPKLPLCSPPSLSLALFSASQTGERLRYNACPTPSQLSCHWLHMKNNETSSETRLQKEEGGSM